MSGGFSPRVLDNDRDEITVTLNGKEIRGWSYENEAERRVKMLAAREFCEGWFQAYDRGRRDVLNAILALNPSAAQKLHVISGGTETTFDNHAGKLPFDVVFWVTEVASQLGVDPKQEAD